MNIKNYKIKQINYCLNCDYNCEFVCPVFNLTNNQALSPKNKAIQALTNIKNWDFSENTNLYACINCQSCKHYCPHGNNISEILEYSKEKVISTENANSRILDFEYDFYRNEKLEALGDFEKNIPDFLTFYNLGFRDEAITELKSYLRNIKANKLVINDISFLHIIKKLKPYLLNIKLPKFKYILDMIKDFKKVDKALFISPNFYQNRDLFKKFASKVYLSDDLIGIESILGSGLEITRPDISEKFYNDLLEEAKRQKIDNIFILAKVPEFEFDGNIINVLELSIDIDKLN